MKVKVAQSCLTLCDPMDHKYRVHGILQARILEWVAFPFSRQSSQSRNQTQVSHIAGGFLTSWTTREAQEYWSGQPILSSADLPDPGIEPGLLHCRWILYRLSYQGSPYIYIYINNIYIYILINKYIYSFFLYCFPLWFITEYWLQFPVLYCRTILYILVCIC